MKNLSPSFQTEDEPVDEAAAAAKGLLGVGVGAGLLGAAMLGLRYLIRPPTKERIPETISPVKFTTHAFQSSCGQMIYHESGGAQPAVPAPGAAGPAVVFIHNVGVGASSYEWSKVYPAFADRHRVLVPDLLGFGESERPRARLTATEYAASLAEFLQAVCGDDAQRPVVIGRGLGAGFAALMAAQNPELASRLILWMPSGRASVPWFLQIASRLPPLNRFIYRNRLARRATIRARFAAPGAFVDPAAVTQEMVEVHAICAQQFQADCAIYRLMQGRMNFDLDSRFREITPPVTLLWPELAASHSYAHALRLQSVNRRSALRVIPKVGPFAPLEAPLVVTDVLKDELQGELRVLKVAS